MFYLKYRPQTLEEIDSTQIRTKLKQVIIPANVPHAILFSGPKGVGKTSAARITAKIVNCQKNAFSDSKQKSTDPCNKCESCIAISKGSMVDVIEIDGASNRKIDDIREIISSARFSPVSGQYKIFIIDEVHMLTREAFNALLKTLEEPAASTIFLLATTEIEKLPRTIVSRCMTINCSPASTEEIIRMLKRITEKEKIKTDQKTLETIALYSDHSFRDAAKILDEAFHSNILNPEGIKKIVGLAHTDDQILHSLADYDLKLTTELIKKYETSGGSFKALIEFMLSELHQHLLAKCQASSSDKKKYRFDIKQTSQLIKLLSEAYSNLKYSPIESLPLQMAVCDYFLKNKQLVQNNQK